MTEYTPLTGQISYGWAAFRGETSGVSSDAAYAEFDRFLAVHDQDIRDSVKPPEMTAREHLEAAFEAACPVPAGHAVPAGVAYIRRRPYPLGFSVGTGTGSFAAGQNIRTLDPLPPLIPDDCMAVWASVAYSKARMLWVRDIGSTGSGNWSNGDDVVIGEALIDPKPVPEEER